MTMDDFEWFKERLPVFIVEDSNGTMVWRNGERVAGWILDNYTGASVQCHLVIDKPMCLRHGVIEAIASLAFDNLKCNAIYALVPSNREKGLKINKHIGFTEKCVLKGAFSNGVDSHILELTPENCKYYKPNYQEVA